jgi:hypothetical protein
MPFPRVWFSRTIVPPPPLRRGRAFYHASLRVLSRVRTRTLASSALISSCRMDTLARTRPVKR